MRAVLPFLMCCCAVAATPTTEIKVDQAGYPASAPKVAMVVSKTQAGDFTIRRAVDGSVAFRGKLAAPVADADSGDRVQTADFSKLEASGKYYLDVPGVGRSWSFAVGPDVYARAYYLAMRAFYAQRCNTAVDLGPEFPGYTHAACHLNGAYHPSTGKTGPKAPSRGWHDAGDYGRYTVNSGMTNGTLLWTWEMFGNRLKDVKLNLPESGNGTPDILNEVRWNQDWMLSMQDDDGGAWQKQTLANFGGFILPEKEDAPSYVVGTGTAPYKSSCATADLAAVAAIAARVYRPFDAAYAAKNLAAARKAWDWLGKYPDVLYLHDPPGIRTGTYGDKDCGDERLWAAAELWRTTREDVYQRYFLAHYSEYTKTLAPGREAAGMERRGALRHVGLRTGRRKGRRGGADHPQPVRGRRRRHRRPREPQRIPRQPSPERLRVGVERHRRKLRPATAGHQRAPPEAAVYRGGARHAALPAGPKHLLAVMGDATWRKSLPTSAPSPERRHREARAVARVPIRRPQRGPARRDLEGSARRPATSQDLRRRAGFLCFQRGCDQLERGISIHARGHRHALNRARKQADKRTHHAIRHLRRQ